MHFKPSHCVVKTNQAAGKNKSNKAWFHMHLTNCSWLQLRCQLDNYPTIYSTATSPTCKGRLVCWIIRYALTRFSQAFAYQH